MEADPAWCASALALTEALVLIDRLTDEPELRRELEDAVRLDWDRVAVVPLDAACLDRAADLARQQPLRLSDSLHLAAADRLPRPAALPDLRPGPDPRGPRPGLRRRLDLRPGRQPGGGAVAVVGRDARLTP